VHSQSRSRGVGAVETSWYGIHAGYREGTSGGGMTGLSAIRDMEVLIAGPFVFVIGILTVLSPPA